MSEATETRNVSLKDIDPSPFQPRPTFDPVQLNELASSIKRHGVRQRIQLRPVGKRFELLDGERRCRAAEMAGLKDIPAEIRPMSDEEAQELALVLNVQRVNLSPMEESDALQKLMKSRSLEELAGIVGKSKRDVHESLAIQRLTNEGRSLLQTGVLPVEYARKIARVAASQQKDAIAVCFGPLYKDQPRRREHLAPMRQLDDWLRDHVRFNPRGQDEAILFPDLVKEIDSTEKRKKIRILLLSTLYRHSDRSDRTALLAHNWKLVDPKKACSHAKEGVIVLGEQQGQIVLACAAKRECKQHWPPQKPPANDTDRRQADERRRQEIEVQQLLHDQWCKDLQPMALQRLADIAGRFKLNRSLVTWLVGELSGKPDGVSKVLGTSLAKLPEKRFVAALVIAAATRHSFSYQAFKPIAKRFALNVPAPSLDIAAAAHKKSA